MAGANMKSIKQRIRSVESTMQITKAMELVASSKLRKAKERAEAARPYCSTLYRAIQEMACRNTDTSSVYTKARPVKRVAYVVISGDRGLAGGYNANILKFAGSRMAGTGALVVPVGRRTGEFFQRRGIPLVETGFGTVEEMDLEAAFELGRLVCSLYQRGEVDEVYLIYTQFVSALTQEPLCRKVLPLCFDAADCAAVCGEQQLTYTTFEPGCVEVLNGVVPQYVGGMIYGAIAESYASEQGARRTAMEAATDNAEEMISTLSLHYNRARQGAITQELSEIVGGAEALS